MELLDYGLSELDKNIDYIVDCQPSTPQELTELVFENANCDGSLTYNRQQALDEILEFYTLNDIFVFLNNEGLDMDYSATVLTEEKIHVLLCEVEFENYITEQIDNYININNSSDAILAVIVELINDGLINVNINDFPKLKKIEENYF